MNSPDPVALPITVGALPWYRSSVYVAQVVTILSTLSALAPKVFIALGLTNPDDLTRAVSAVFGVVSLFSATYGAVQRARSPVQPLTITQAKAESHPATIQAERVASALVNSPPPKTA